MTDAWEPAFRLAVIEDMRQCIEHLQASRGQLAAGMLHFENNKLVESLIQKRCQDIDALVKRLQYSIDVLSTGRPMYWRLNDDKSVSPIHGTLENDEVLEWAREFERTDQQLADTMVEGRRVSTVFLGLDHGFGSGPPLIFESMVFSETTRTHKAFGEEREYHESLDQRRYSTYAEAMKGHEEMVAETRAIVARMNQLKPGDGHGQDQG